MDGTGWMRGRRAFSLVELLVVLAVLSVLAALLLPTLEQSVDSARRLQCGRQVAQFVVALQMYGADNRQVIIDHAGDSHILQGRMAPWFPALVEGRYLAGVELLVCPTVGDRYGYGGYSANPRSVTNPGGGWNNWPQWFWAQNAPVRSGSPANPYTGCYDSPMGTYFYWGGGGADTNTNRRWCAGSGFRMRQGHVLNASKYAVLWDQDAQMSGAIAGQTAHMIRPGRSYAFYDGHVTFVTDDSIACSALVTAPAGFRMSFVTEHMTPMVCSNFVTSYAEGTACGTRVYDTAGRALAAGVLRLP